MKSFTLVIFTVLLGVVMVPRPVRAHDGEGGFWDRSGCCHVYYTGHCVARPDHPEPSCQQGHEVGEVETHGCGCLWFPGECRPAIAAGSVPELPNGRDDDCDYYVDDEQCDGVDNDNDGRVDEDPGSCLLKIMFVPLSFAGSQADFEAAAQAQWDLFKASLHLEDCPDNFAHYYASVSTDNLPAPDCSSGCGIDSVVDSFRAHFGSTVEADYNVVAAITDRDLCGNVAGCRDGGGIFVWAQAGNTSEPILAHEMGHIFGLRDEYCSTDAGSDDYRCNQGRYPQYSAPPNYLGADLLCDPRGGYGCCEGCEPGPMQICCQGNVNPLGGRDIMSYADAEGPRAFDGRSAAHLTSWIAQTVPLDCDFPYDGLERIVTVDEDLDDQGQMSLHSASVRFARPGVKRFSTSGRYGLELLRADGVALHSSAEDISFDYDGPMRSGVDYTALHFSRISRYLRIPVASGGNGPFKVRSLLDGAVVSQTCLNPGVEQADGSVELTRDTVAPEIACPADLSLECRQAGGTSGTEIELSAFLAFPASHVSDSCDSTPQVTNNAPALFPVGLTPVVFEAADADGNSSSCTAQVTIIDTIAPQLAVTASPAVLWPPNHKYAAVSVSLSAADTCDSAVASRVELVSVSSDEPEDAPGQGDGKTLDDIVIVNRNIVNLRKERSGRGDGRVYTLNYRVTDASGNAITAAAVVTVPRSASKAARNSGPVYVVTNSLLAGTGASTAQTLQNAASGKAGSKRPHSSGSHGRGGKK